MTRSYGLGIPPEVIDGVAAREIRELQRREREYRDERRPLSVKGQTVIGSPDEPVIEMNREALARLRCEKKLEIVPGATHLFEEPGTLEQVAVLAREWFNARRGTAATPLSPLIRPEPRYRRMPSARR